LGINRQQSQRFRQRAFTFMQDDPGWKRDRATGATWLLLAPVGWPLALGYRRRVAMCLVDGRLPLLPGWATWRDLLTDGLKASAIILLHLTPFFAMFWLLALAGLPTSERFQHRAEIGIFLPAFSSCRH